MVRNRVGGRLEIARTRPGDELEVGLGQEFGLEVDLRTVHVGIKRTLEKWKTSFSVMKL